MNQVGDENPYWRRREPDEGHLAGVTPVTRKSGKHGAVHFRRACSNRFGQPVTTFAGCQRTDPASLIITRTG